MTKFRTGVAIAALLIATPAMAVTDVTGMTSDEYVSTVMDAANGVAHKKPKRAAHEPKDCAAIRAFNEKAPSMAAMKILPCHCIPMRERVDKVYTHAPAGFTCGNHVFYDKQCHQGMTCFKEGLTIEAPSFPCSRRQEWPCSRGLLSPRSVYVIIRFFTWMGGWRRVSYSQIF